MRIVIQPHARERMEEKGATEEEIRMAVREGQLSPARYGRQKHRLTFSFERFRWSKFFRSKQLEVYSFDEGDTLVVVTVVVRYF